MKITRNQFLKLISAAALTLTGCGSKAQPANTESLVFSHHYKLDYAQQFTADCYEGGYTMLTIAESDARFLVVPEDATKVDGLPADVTVLQASTAPRITSRSWQRAAALPLRIP